MFNRLKQRCMLVCMCVRSLYTYIITVYIYIGPSGDGQHLYK